MYKICKYYVQMHYLHRRRQFSFEASSVILSFKAYITFSRKPCMKNKSQNFRIVYHEQYQTRAIPLKQPQIRTLPLSNTINLFRKKSMVSIFARKLHSVYLFPLAPAPIKIEKQNADQLLNYFIPSSLIVILILEVLFFFHFIIVLFQDFKFLDKHVNKFLDKHVLF